jgi:hypothetical protein
MLPHDILPIPTALHDMRVQNIGRTARSCIHWILVFARLLGWYVFDPHQHVRYDNLIVAGGEDRDLGDVFVAELVLVLSEEIACRDAVIGT